MFVLNSRCKTFFLFSQSIFCSGNFTYIASMYVGKIAGTENTLSLGD